MSKFETPKGKYEQYFAKPKRKAGELKGLEEIAKEAMEETEYIPNNKNLLLIPKDIITITKEKYEELIRDVGYYQGRMEELEKQLEEFKSPEETTIIYSEEKPYIEKKYCENVKYKFLNSKAYKIRLETEIKRLCCIKEKSIGEPQAIIERINGKIEGIEYAIKLIEEE